MIQFIQRFSQDIAQQTSGTVLIGDMGMPAGGRFSSGHASHQIGLDVDIWLQLPRQRWTAQQLLHPQPLDLVTADDKSVVNRLWSRDIDTMVRQASEILMSHVFLLTRQSNSSYAWTLGAIVNGCRKSVLGLHIAPTCT